MGTPAPVDIHDLVTQHYRAVYRYGYRLTGNAADAEDLTQQTFLRAHRSLEQLRQTDLADRWLLKIIRNEFLRKVGRPVTAANPPDVPAAPSPAQDDADELRSALAGLSDEFRLPLLLFYFEELSYREIAEELGVPIGTVMSRLSRARDALRSRLQVGRDADVGRSQVRNRPRS
jgi:RNA polymerase sigma-70 factor (ECF subfamily)